ncbi:excinuclease ABC subunit UvrC [Aquirufa regiilacus]|uniref:UvrABC system protein C n=1 Tax=Aquirufa regiilacus TaxID=3024868 RepID=A0ABU3TU56_9BACT|nr:MULTISPECIES: excinuclease ABC subunit UvrC [unclassified Aquirufa]MBP6094547.1 excinuclease ABC subunit C [Cytophagaceae bacterium]MDT8887639.1 excinuclease ABC subunit UvrC [Aquirufa sp. LEPPI-3A]MDU0809349.1 excinuclease ABC subunit UvrC [Aquirufa sp. LEOWEIH-7C]
MSNFDPKSILPTLPDQPGVYRYFDENDTIIYIGKAKNLKNRVSSYFTSIQNHNTKTRRLVQQIQKIEFTIVHSEFDALLLENTLIKQFQPKYNILLRDDKTYPFICLTNEHFPRLITMRRIDHAIGTFFGPFANPKAMNGLLEMVHQLYPIRTCTLALKPANIEQGKFKVCLEYHIGNCKGPCEGLQNESDYQIYIEQITNILKGNYQKPKSLFFERMQQASARMAFEEAQEWKEKWELLENFQAKSTVVNPAIHDVDVFTMVSDEALAYINFMKVINGTILQSQTWEVKKKLNEDESDLLTMLIWEKREQFHSEAKEILTNIPMAIEFQGAKNTIPQMGDKKKLLDMSLKNVLYFRKEKADRKAAEESGGDRKMRVMLKLKNDLRLTQLPKRIECFDNSNLQGTNPVSAMVCFIQAQAAKKEYRLFTPRTVEGPDDFATMHEVITRRYTRLLEEEAELPDLIIVDGGKGQLSAACDALKAIGLYGQIPIIGIAKRLEEIYFPEDSLPVYIDKKSESLKLIQQLRDEAHRFGITAHRNRRSKNFLVSQLEELEGIGKLTAQKLLKHFGTIRQMYDAPVEELEKVAGKAKTPMLRKQIKIWLDEKA